MDLINTTDIQANETNVNWYEDGEAANADVLNRPTKQVAEVVNEVITKLQDNEVALGLNSGETNQGTNAIAIGENAGKTNQPANTIAIGLNSTPANEGDIIIQTTSNVIEVTNGGMRINGNSIGSTSVNGIAPDDGNVTINAADVGAVPTSRTVNGKALSANISLSAADVGALSTSGTAAAATKLATARKINGVSFDGTKDISITSATPSTLTKGSYLTGSNFNGSNATTWAVDATSTNTASKVVARDSYGNFSAATITATLSGNASSATKLATPRAINGANFDGSAAITTENWGTARNITIGSTVKSVNGSANVAWSLAEIGAVPTSRTVNGKPLTTNISLTAADVGAVPNPSTHGNAPEYAPSLGSKDLNSVTTYGFYCQPLNADATTARNYPVMAAGSLTVTKGALGCIQEYKTYTAGITYTRGLYNGTWSVWQKFYSTTQKPTAADVGTYTKAEVDALIAAKTPAPSVSFYRCDYLSVYNGRYLTWSNFPSINPQTETYTESGLSISRGIRFTKGGIYRIKASVSFTSKPTRVELTKRSDRQSFDNYIILHEATMADNSCEVGGVYELNAGDVISIASTTALSSSYVTSLLEIEYLASSSNTSYDYQAVMSHYNPVILSRQLK